MKGKKELKEYRTNIDLILWSYSWVLHQKERRQQQKEHKEAVSTPKVLKNYLKAGC